MNYLLLLLSIIIKIIILIIIILILLFKNKIIENFIDAPPNQCVRYKTTIDNTLKPIIEDYILSEIAVSNAENEITKARNTPATTPDYDKKIQDAIDAKNKIAYNRDCKAKSMDAINIINTTLSNLIPPDVNVNIPQASDKDCDHLYNKIIEPLSDILTSNQNLYTSLNNLRQELEDKQKILISLSPISPNYLTIFKEIQDKQKLYQKADDYKKCYDNSTNTVFSVVNAISPLLSKNNEDNIL